jgi:hypothetical protein
MITHDKPRGLALGPGLSAAVRGTVEPLLWTFAASTLRFPSVGGSLHPPRSRLRLSEPDLLIVRPCGNLVRDAREVARGARVTDLSVV